MGRLGGYRYRQVAAFLTQRGFVLGRQAKGSHEIWESPSTGRRTVLVNHPGTIPEGTLRNVLRLAEISVDDFLGG
jgi:predicted RNA binding protein YcfA (HicA-like mRNA interferase family)